MVSTLKDKNQPFTLNAAHFKTSKRLKKKIILISYYYLPRTFSGVILLLFTVFANHNSRF